MSRIESRNHPLVAVLLSAIATGLGHQYLLVTAQSPTEQTIDGDEMITRCPACRGELDVNLGLCHWCATEFEMLHIVRPNTNDTTIN